MMDGKRDTRASFCAPLSLSPSLARDAGSLLSREARPAGRPRWQDDDRGAARVQGRRKGRHGAVRHGGAGRKAWIIAKKDKARAKGAPVAADSRYTGRKRRPKF